MSESTSKKLRIDLMDSALTDMDTVSRLLKSVRSKVPKITANITEAKEIKEGLEGAESLVKTARYTLSCHRRLYGFLRQEIKQEEKR